ncbi:MAG: tetratricopeptide (TPR) repeat protein, partial [Gammaproteobacteria bacterium]
SRTGPFSLNDALAHHRAGDLARAAQLYRQLLSHDPDHADALHLLGVVALQSGDSVSAITHIREAITKGTNQPAFHSNLGEALRISGELEAAAAAFAGALALDSEFADAHSNLGATLLALGRVDAAVEHLESAVRINPNFPEAYMNLGNAMKDQGRYAKAARCFAKVVELNPDIVQAHVNLGNALKKSGDPRGAQMHYEQAIHLRPQWSEAHTNLALLHAEQDRFDEARDVFQRLFEMTYGNEYWHVTTFTLPQVSESAPIETTRFALIDSAEHIEHLIGQGKLDASFSQMAGAYRSVIEQLPGADDDALLTLTSWQSGKIASFFRKIIRFVDAPRVAPSAVNPELDFRAIEDAYLTSPIAVTCFDNFLTPTALRALYEFCLDSTIFVGQARGGFLTSYMGAGFHCSLLFQIVEELKQAFPRLLANQTLGNMWVYRYPSEGEGVRAHTDEGSVTFNFWITPDVANLEIGRGGLVTYTKEQPLDWDWQRFNLDKDDSATRKEIDSFLLSANTETIEYRANRALLFHSNLFHRSDYFRFKDDYQSRRMNVTLLFGERGTDVRLRDL